MNDYDKITAMAVVKAKTEFGKRCLREIHGLKEGTLLKGTYQPITHAFDFVYNGEDAMLWIGENGQLVSLGEEQEYRYMMLDRLLYDCRLFIRVSPNNSMLYYPSIAEHMAQVRKLWDELYIKPEWLSIYKQIGRLEHKMNVRKTIYDRRKRNVKPKINEYGTEKNQENKEGHWQDSDVGGSAN